VIVADNASQADTSVLFIQQLTRFQLT